MLKLLEQDKSLTEVAIKAFGKDILAGLRYLHERGIIFVDLRPSNLLLNEYSVVKLADFGQARRIVDLTPTESKRGTPYYMAPELFQDGSVYSYYSDFWAFGCVLYEMAAGHPPFVS